MPELPEVETIRRQLEPLVVGSSIADAWAFDSAKFTPAHDAVGGHITSLRRRGKYLIAVLADLSEPSDPSDRSGPDAESRALELVIHLGMTGRLSVAPLDPVDPFEPVRAGRRAGRQAGRQAGWTADDSPHLRAAWLLDRGGTRSFLSYVDVRRFGRIAVVPAGDYASLPTLAALGPEPFDDAFSPEWLRSRVNGSRRAVKTQLLSQRVVAGVGNIYADEALWRARVHPAARRLTRDASARLRDAIRAVLQSGITHGGTTLRDYRDASGSIGSNQHELVCYGRVGKPCHRCGRPLERIVLDARSTTLCSRCQRR